MIKDRGNIKWSSLMLTEHRERLKELFDREDDRKKPVLDEQMKEELDLILKGAIQQKYTLRIVYYQKRRLQEIKGIITGYDPLKKQLVINRGGMVIHLNIGDIVELTSN